MAENKQLTVKDYMAAPQVVKRMQEMLQSPEAVRKFTTAVISSSAAMPENIEPRSYFNACLMSASLGLPINNNLGLAYIIPFENRKKGVVEAQYQIGVRGYKELAQRSGRYKIINEGDVRKGELKGRNRLTGELDFNWIENDEEREKAPIIGYFSYFELDNGFKSMVYMSRDEVTEHAKKYSQAYQFDLKKGYASSPWSKNFDAMALKTVTKKNLKHNGPMSIDDQMTKAMEADQAVIKDDGTAEYVEGEVVDVEEKKAITKARIEAAAAKRQALDEADHTPEAVQTDDVVEVSDDELDKIETGELLNSEDKKNDN